MCFPLHFIPTLENPTFFIFVRGPPEGITSAWTVVTAWLQLCRPGWRRVSNLSWNYFTYMTSAAPTFTTRVNVQHFNIRRLLLVGKSINAKYNWKTITKFSVNIFSLKQQLNNFTRGVKRFYVAAALCQGIRKGGEGWQNRGNFCAVLNMGWQVTMHEESWDHPEDGPWRRDRRERRPDTTGSDWG